MRRVEFCPGITTSSGIRRKVATSNLSKKSESLVDIYLAHHEKSVKPDTSYWRVDTRHD